MEVEFISEVKRMDVLNGRPFWIVWMLRMMSRN